MGAVQEKVEELMLYLARRMAATGHVDVGRLKMAKLLFEIDFRAFAEHNRAVTGARYHADRLGPVPDEEMLACRDLEASGRLKWEPAHNRNIPIALDEPDLDVFDEWELELVERVLADFRTVPANVMVDKAHRFPGWIHAWDDGRGQNEPVPYEAIFWDGDRRMVADWENEHAAALAAKYRITATG